MVCFVDVNESLGEKVQAEVQKLHGPERTYFLKCDVTNEHQLEEVFKGVVAKFGHLDIVCNNAGTAVEDNWSRLLDINLKGVIHGTMLAFKYMGKAVGRQHGTVVNNSSIAGVVPFSAFPVYSASKHGITGFTRAIGVTSVDLHGVTVNCLCPTNTDTPLHDTAFRTLNAVPGDMNEQSAATLKLGIMPPSEVAECLLELLANKHLSGATMLVSPKVKKFLRHPTSLEELLADFS